MYEDSPQLSHIKRKLFPRIKNGYNTGFTTSSYQSPELTPILKRIEDKVFVGTQKAYTVYKSFDVDKDGNFVILK